MNYSTAIGHLLFPVLFVTVLPVYGQTDAKASALLAKVSKIYESYRTLQADFTIDVQQAQQAPQKQNSGTIYLQASAEKYHIVMDNEALISDGKTLWTLLKDEKEVQITTVDHSSGSISPATIFSFYKEGYKFVSGTAERAGATPLDVIELSPENAKTSPYFKIKLRINKTTGFIHDVTVFDKSGVRYTYAIKQLKKDPSITASMFTFDQADYPGFELVDLR